MLVLLEWGRMDDGYQMEREMEVGFKQVCMSGRLAFSLLLARSCRCSLLGVV